MSILDELKEKSFEYEEKARKVKPSGVLSWTARQRFCLTSGYKKLSTIPDYDIDPERGLNRWVIVVAPETKIAFDRFSSIGVYFGGVSSKGLKDCDCCGPRWALTHIADIEPKIDEFPVTSPDCPKWLMTRYNIPKGQPFVVYHCNLGGPYWKKLEGTIKSSWPSHYISPQPASTPHQP